MGTVGRLSQNHVEFDGESQAGRALPGSRALERIRQIGRGRGSWFARSWARIGGHAPLKARARAGMNEEIEINSISGLVAEYIVAIDVIRVRFPADACTVLLGSLSARRRRKFFAVSAHPSFHQLAAWSSGMILA